jgi:PAS domain S-box-containing protein
LSLVKATGEYQRIHRKWFGVLEPPPITLQSVLKYLLLATAVFLLVSLVLIVWSVSLKKLVSLRTKELEEEIRERQIAEAARRQSEQQASFLSNLLEESSQPFAISYPDGRFGIYNAAVAQLLGYSRAELMELDWAKDLTPPEWLDKERTILEKLHSTGQPVRYEKEYIRQDGTRVPVELFVHLYRTQEGQPEYYYAFITDITERQRAAEEKAKLEAQLVRAQKRDQCL